MTDLPGDTGATSDDTSSWADGGSPSQPTSPPEAPAVAAAPAGSGTTPAPPNSAPPGWYPDAGGQRYWDGIAWTDQAIPPATAPGGAPTNDDRTLAMLAHLLAVVGGFLPPLIIWLLRQDGSPLVIANAKESLNFQLTLMIAWLVSFGLLFILIGIVLMPILAIVQVVMPIVAALAANKGEMYRYPLTLRLIS